MIFEEIGVCDTLSDKNTICYESKLSIVISLIIESDSIPYLLTHLHSSLFTHPSCHTNRRHSSRLCDDNINLIDCFLFTLSVLLYIILCVDDGLSNHRGVHGVLWELG